MRKPRRVPDQDNDKNQKKRRAPGRTVEARENQLISLAIDLAEKQILNGTASSQVITHFLKLGSTTQKLELEKLEKENILLKAKTEVLHSAKKVEELYANALSAMRSYTGQVVKGVVDEDD